MALADRPCRHHVALRTRPYLGAPGRYRKRHWWLSPRGARTFERPGRAAQSPSCCGLAGFCPRRGSGRKQRRGVGRRAVVRVPTPKGLSGCRQPGQIRVGSLLLLTSTARKVMRTATIAAVACLSLGASTLKAFAQCYCGPDFCQSDPRVGIALESKKAELRNAGCPDRLTAPVDSGDQCVARSRRLQCKSGQAGVGGISA